MGFLRNLFGKTQKEDISTPSVEDIENAKKVFFEYSCNHYYMSREGIDFKNYHISREQEQEWRSEFIAHWISKLSIDALEAVHRLEGAYAIESVPELIAVAEKGDSYAKLWIANAIWTISFKNDTDKDLRKRTRDIAIRLLNSIIESQVQLSENHRNEIPIVGIKNLGASTPEEYIVNYAKHILKEAQK